MRRVSLLIIMLTAFAAFSINAQKLQGSDLLKFGWKLDKCTSIIGDMTNYVTTTDPKNVDVERFSYSPANWCSINFDGSILDFYKNRLYQIGFYKNSTIADRTTFDAIVRKLTELYGEPKQLKADDPYHLMWRSKEGNIAMTEYNYTGSEFATFLILIDNATSIKKAKDARRR